MTHPSGLRRPPASRLRALRYRLAGLAGMGLALLLTACGGGGPAAEPVIEPPPGLIGVATDALVAQDALDVTVKGSAGLARTASTILSGTNFQVTLAELAGPYLVQAERQDGSFLLAAATAPGTVNLTPLTTLVVAQLLADDPASQFEALGFTGGVTPFTDAQLADAQTAVAYHLYRRLQLDWRGSSSFTTTPFSPVAGDPGYDRLRALNAALAAQSQDIASLVSEVALQAGRCQATQLSLTLDGTTHNFCPQTSTTQRDDLDRSVLRHSFGDLLGDTLTVQVRGDTLVSVQLQAEGQVLGCNGAACSGLTLGEEDANGNRPLRFAGMPLSGEGGHTAQLSGELLAVALGINLPPLPCLDNIVYQIPDAGPVTGFCAEFTGDTRGIQRQAYNLADLEGAAPYELEVVAAGDQVVSVTLYETRRSGARAAYRCTGTACVGVSIGAADSAGQRRVSLLDTPLLARKRDGSPSGDPGMQVRATLTVVDETRDFGTYCGAGFGVLMARPSDESADVPVCQLTQIFEEEAGWEGMSGVSYETATRQTYFVSTLEGVYKGNGEFDGGVADRLRLSLVRGELREVVFLRRDGQTFRCQRSTGCAGVSLSAPNGLGEVTVSFTGTVLGERDTGDIPGDRTLTLNGSFVVTP